MGIDTSPNEIIPFHTEVAMRLSPRNENTGRREAEHRGNALKGAY
jgi:hypothetical protein